MRFSIDVPECLEGYGQHMADLLQLQIAKLFVNAHKSHPEFREVEILIARLKDEIKELEDDLANNRFKGNALLEIADIANFALLAYIALRTEQMKVRVNESNSVKDDFAPRTGVVERGPVSDHANGPSPVGRGAQLFRRLNGAKTGNAD